MAEGATFEPGSLSPGEEAAEYAHKPLPLTTNLVLVLLALVLSAVTYSLVENPIRHSRWLAGRPHISVIGAALLAVTCVAFTYLF
jgi:peptidoglycan/LPS O-acetylase OafA/YrhL